MAATTTVCLDPKVKQMLNGLKTHREESYNSVIERIANMAYDSEPLTNSEIEGIEESLRDIKAGKYYSEDEAKKMLGIDD
jgi:predicted transcriptional regulator